MTSCVSQEIQKSCIFCIKPSDSNKMDKTGNNKFTQKKNC